MGFGAKGLSKYSRQEAMVGVRHEGWTRAREGRKKCSDKSRHLWREESATLAAPYIGRQRKESDDFKGHRGLFNRSQETGSGEGGGGAGNLGLGTVGLGRW